MRIGLVTPAPSGSTYGNRITALRWARILRKLGHRVAVSEAYENDPYDLLIALHARRSFSSIKRFRNGNNDAPVIVALTGTDLYRDIRSNHLARKSLEIATRIVVLQAKGLEKLEPRLRGKTRVIHQSAEDVYTTSKPAVRPVNSPSPGFVVSVIGHLRPVKDPFRAALAARLLPHSSHIRILQIGTAMTEAMARRAQAEMRTNPRYRWVGERPQSRARRILTNSQLCVLSSRMEGGANILSEAIVASVPILASRIEGNIGVLGSDYPGLFRVGDTHQLARLLSRAETDAGFLAELRDRVRELAPIFDPEREQRAWAHLIEEVSTEAFARQL